MPCDPGFSLVAVLGVAVADGGIYEVGVAQLEVVGDEVLGDDFDVEVAAGRSLAEGGDQLLLGDARAGHLGMALPRLWWTRE